VCKIKEGVRATGGVGEEGRSVSDAKKWLFTHTRWTGRGREEKKGKR